MQKLAIVPCSVFIFFAALSASAGLLNAFPSSGLLWWINIEVFSQSRTTYYFLEKFVLFPSPIMITCSLLFLAIATAGLANLQKLSFSFFSNHIAAILVAISLISTRTAPIANNDASFIDSGKAILSPMVSSENLFNLLLLVLTLVSCGVSHYMILTGRGLRLSRSDEAVSE